MKRNFFLEIFTFLMFFPFLGTLNGLAQPAADVTTAIEWTAKTYDFGKIPRGKPVTAEFQFKNPSLVPLIINSVRPTCGCTIADYPKEPVAPQKTGSIKVTFNAASPGYFQKSIVVTTNAGEASEVLIIKGEVIIESEQNPATSMK